VIPPLCTRYAGQISAPPKQGADGELWGHVVQNLLARNNVTWDDFKTQMGKGQWKEMMLTIHEVMTIWKNSFETCAFEDTTLATLCSDANLI
jgi:hypothetical protein